MSEGRRIPDALLERYLAQDLAAEARADVEAKLAASASERARLEELRADSAAYLIKHPPGPLLAKAGLDKPARPRWWLVLAPLGAVACLALVVLAVREREPDSQVKGGLVLSVFRQREGGAAAERLPSGATLSSGDRVRFEVRAPADGWVAVLSRDGAGRVTVYYPDHGRQAAPYTTSAALLPGATGLDDTRGPEQVWAVHGASPFALDPLVKALEAGGAPSAQGLSAARFDWVKQ